MTDISRLGRPTPRYNDPLPEGGELIFECRIIGHDLRKIAGVMNKTLFGRTFTDQHRFQYKFAGIKLSGIIEDKMTDFMVVPSPIWEINFIDTNGSLLKAVESPNTPVELRLGCK